MEPEGISLAQAAEESRIISARCERCHHEAAFLAADLTGILDPAKPIRMIRFRCTQCDGRDCRIDSIEVDRDRCPDIIVWRPTRLR